MNNEKQKQFESLDVLYDELIDKAPIVVSTFVPEKNSGTQQKVDFLDDKIRNPDHIYDKLENFDRKSLVKRFKEIKQEIITNPGVSEKQIPTYEAFIDDYIKKAKFLGLAAEYNKCDDKSKKKKIAEKYTGINIDLYGGPEESIYRSLLEEKLSKIQKKPMIGSALEIKRELFDMVNFDYSKEWVRDRFEPSREALDWMSEVVMDLYGGMLARVPDQKEFSPTELKKVFDDIIKNEFDGDEFDNAAKEWRVDIEPAKSIDVKNQEKRIVIPEDRGILSQKKVRKLVVHELGVHFLRCIAGEDLDLRPLRNGVGNFESAEEGLAKIMEQALDGKYAESGVNYYVTAGLAYFDKKDFRDIFEVNWRISALLKIDEMGELSDEIIAKSKNSAYSDTMRIMRGTDELPWFKDLAYYNGAVKMWRYLESIKYDDIKFTFLLMGKCDPSDPAHDRIMYEAKNRPYFTA